MVVYIVEVVEGWSALDPASHYSRDLFVRGCRTCGVSWVDSALDSLVAFVLFLEDPLHVEIELTFALNALLFHIAHNALMHGLVQEDG